MPLQEISFEKWLFVKQNNLARTIFQQVSVADDIRTSNLIFIQFVCHFL